MELVQEFCKKTYSLLELEQKSEAVILKDKIENLSGKQCVKEGISLLNLVIDKCKSGLFGRCIICLVPSKHLKNTNHETSDDDKDKKKDSSRVLDCCFKVGDEVNLYSTQQSQSDKNDKLFGLVTKIGNFSLEIAVNSSDYDESSVKNYELLRLDLALSVKTHNVMVQALTNIKENCYTHPLVNLLFTPPNENLNTKYLYNKDEVNSLPTKADTELNFIHDTLNASQRNAVQSCLTSNCSLIHGPPGTGKTSTLTEFIIQSSNKGMKILVCAPSNIAVDTILMRLAYINEKYGGTKGKSNKSKRSKDKFAIDSQCKLTRSLKMVRIGHPARVSELILPYTLDSRIYNDEGTDIVRDVREEINSIRKDLFRDDNKSSSSKSKSKYLSRAVVKEKKQELKSLIRETKDREREVVNRILHDSNIVFCTCIGANSKLLRDIEFDLVVIDEAAQSLEIACWVPLMMSNRCVLAGDHCQLPPTIKNGEAEKGGLSVTLFERIIKDARFSSIVSLLDTQYRMNSLICDWASKEMYENKIRSHESVADHTLNDFVDKTIGENIGQVAPVLLLVDTCGCGGEGDRETETGSHSNREEAELIYKHVINLGKKGVPCSHIGIITPYNGQLDLLKTIFFSECEVQENSSKMIDFSELEIKTIDGFQGGEKECIIISLVRSNAKHQFGFLADHRRINVGVTRAKRHLAIFCDTETCCCEPFINTLIEHISAKGVYLSALEYNDYYESTDSLEDLMSIRKDEKAENQYTANETITVLSSKPNKSSVFNITRLSIRDAELQAFKDVIAFYKEGMVPPGKVETDPKSIDADVSSIRLVSKDNQSGKYLGHAVRKSSLVFPRSLTSYQRMNIHSICDELQIFHRSLGSGTKRFIEVNKVEPFEDEEQHIEEVQAGKVPIRDDQQVKQMVRDVEPLNVQAVKGPKENKSPVLGKDCTEVKKDISEIIDEQTHTNRNASKLTQGVTKINGGNSSSKISEKNKELKDLHLASLKRKEEKKKQIMNQLDQCNDIDDFLNLAADQAKQREKDNQYKVPLMHGSMANPEKIKAKETLRNKLKEAELKRIKKVPDKKTGKKAGSKK